MRFSRTSFIIRLVPLPTTWRSGFHTHVGPLYSRKITRKPYAPKVHPKDVIPPSLSAFGARLGLRFSDPNTLLQVVIDESYQDTDLPSNKKFKIIGEKVCRLFVTEHFHIKYPLMPLPTLQELIKVYIGPETLNIFGQEIGLPNVLRYQKITDQMKGMDFLSETAEPKHTYESPMPQKAKKSVNVSLAEAMIHSIHAIIAARQFVHSFILTREANVGLLYESHCKLPKAELSVLMKRLGQIPPISRQITVPFNNEMLKETGRNTRSPVFVIGIFSGIDKLAESYGSSIKMAEFKAAREALKLYYLKEVKDYTLPSEVLKGDIKYIPTKVGDTPVII
ncbi:hypothetical protein G9A89_012244 [Geosiphon pyriformis]|nr:hypothetical protein G9A89_012244 [Geosiphon pyriformis]